MNRPVILKFRLYIAGHTLNSAQAAVNLRRICDNHFAGRHSIETVDVLREPAKALADGIFMTPTLVRYSPAPDVRMVGTLNQMSTVLLALGLPDGPA